MRRLPAILALSLLGLSLVSCAGLRVFGGVVCTRERAETVVTVRKGRAAEIDEIRRNSDGSRTVIGEFVLEGEVRVPPGQEYEKHEPDGAVGGVEYRF